MDSFTLRQIMLACILFASAVGILLPFIIVRQGGQQILQSKRFDIMQCFAVGLICGVAVLHIYADAQEQLESVSGDFPVAGCFLLIGVFMMLTLNRLTSLIAARHVDGDARTVNNSPLNSDRATELDTEGGQHVNLSFGSRARPISRHGSGSFHGHAHQRLLLDPTLGASGASQLKAYFSEVAIAVHSVLVGLGVGLNDDVVDVLTLGIAVCFHQVFEGIAVGSEGARVQLKGRPRSIMIVLFSCSCPLGVAIGMAIASSIDTDSSEACWILGSLNAFAAGTLVEIGCVDMLPELFSHKDCQSEKVSWTAEIIRQFSLAAGMMIMAVLAIWA